MIAINIYHVIFDDCETAKSLFQLNGNTDTLHEILLLNNKLFSVLKISAMNSTRNRQTLYLI